MFGRGSGGDIFGVLVGVVVLDARGRLGRMPITVPITRVARSIRRAKVQESE